jgi:hypothetical protein
VKAKFLDPHNCYSLLPPSRGLPVLKQLDECLQGINSKPGILNGSIDALIRQNQKTINTLAGSKRLIRSPIEIGQKSFYETHEINTQALAKRFPGPALYHTVLGYENGMAHKTIVPLQFLLKGWGDASRGYQGYVHTITENARQFGTLQDLFAFNMRASGTYYYVGITSRNWLLRLDEHVREMSSGSPRLFYRAWRERYGRAGMLFTSYLDDINLTYQDAMNWEESKVDNIANDQYGLNMIPGGFKGLRFLHKCRIIESTDISLEERDHAIAEYCRRNPRKGLPNPFIAELWKDDNFYLKVIEAKEKTLSPDQVKRIRLLNKQGQSVSKIVNEVHALNERQVKNVISGRTYKRIQ